jgi:SAM-dependent methyltransferase
MIDLSGVTPGLAMGLLESPSREWDRVYTLRGETGVSWYQSSSRWAVDAIKAFCPDPASVLIDVGAGASNLVDGLLLEGYRDITLLDCSMVGLSLTRARLLACAELATLSASVRWVHADLLSHALSPCSFDAWHDRAVFHFLTRETDRARYRQLLGDALRPGGFLCLSTFSEDGPPRCSGRPVMRYSIDSLVQALGPDLELVCYEYQRHRTPAGQDQSFLSACFRAGL